MYSLVLLVDPESITAIDGTTVQFTCTANNTEDIIYRVNGTSAASVDNENKGFEQLGMEGMSTLRRNLSVSVSSLYNNTEIFCRAIGTDNNINSNTAILTVQGILNILHIIMVLLLVPIQCRSIVISWWFILFFLYC